MLGMQRSSVTLVARNYRRGRIRGGGDSCCECYDAINGTDWMVTDVPATSQRALTIFAVAALKYARLIGRLDGHRGIFGRKGVRCSTCR